MGFCFAQLKLLAEQTLANENHTMADVFRTTRRVEFRETDAAGIAHFTSFFAYMEEAEHALLRQLGTSVVALTEQGKISWPRVSASCDYTSPVRFEDDLNIEVRVDHLGKKSVTYAFWFFHQRNEVAKGQLTSVCCHLPPEKAMQAIDIPPTLVAGLSSFQVHKDAPPTG